MLGLGFTPVTSRVTPQLPANAISSTCREGESKRGSHRARESQE